MPHRRQNPQRDRNDHRHANGQGGEQQGRREFGNKRLEHVLPGNIADAHVAPHHTAHPGKVLGEKGLVQTQFRPFRVDDLLRHRTLIAVKLDDGIAAGHAHHGKGQEGDTNENGYQL